MNTLPTLILSFAVFRESNLLQHIDSMHGSSCLHKGKVERVSVVRGYDCRLGFANMLKETVDESGLVIQGILVLQALRSGLDGCIPRFLH